METRMGLLRFELRLRRPERRRMVQATLQPLLVWGEGIHQFYVGEQHPAAAVSIDTKVVQDLPRILEF